MEFRGSAMATAHQLDIFHALLLHSIGKMMSKMVANIADYNWQVYQQLSTT
jgi:hypothetical protein